MATLKSIKAHAVAVGNIQKITNTIKMVATSKFLFAEKNLRHARVFGNGTRRFYQVTNVSYDVRNGRSTVVTSDRGLCGGLHTKICRKVRTDQFENPSDGGIVCLGEKAKSLLAMNFKKNFRLVVNGVGHRGPTFKQASSITQRVFDDWHLAMLTFPFFKNIVSHEVITIPMMTFELVSKSPVPYKYEFGDSQDLDFYFQFSSASLIFYAMNEAFVCELASRITAMSMATRNANKMKKLLMLQFNRKRQEKITTEISDIISGLKATEKKKKKTDVKLRYLMEEASPLPADPSQELLQHLPIDETVKSIQEALLQTPETKEVTPLPTDIELPQPEAIELSSKVQESPKSQTEESTSFVSEIEQNETGELSPKDTKKPEPEPKETPTKKTNVCDDDREPEF